jgi:hypothetical protein
MTNWQNCAASGMLRRNLSIAFGASVVALVVLTATWFTLNYFRVQYYNDSIEGPSPQTSPYWTIIRTQDILHWPIAFAALCVVVLLLAIAARYVGQVIFNHKGAVKR